MEERVGRCEFNNKMYADRRNSVDTLDLNPHSPHYYYQLVCRNIIDDSIYMNGMSLVTLWTLFSNNMRLLSSSSSDETYSIIISIIFFLQMIEITVSSYCKSSYFIIPLWRPSFGESFLDTWRRRLFIGGFYFWLDLVATLSLLSEMDWITSSSNTSQTQSFVGIATRIGAKSNQFAKTIKCIGVIRILRLMKYIHQKVNIADAVKSSSNSQVGSRMTDLTNQRVIVLITSLIIVIFSLSVQSQDHSMNLASQFVHKMAVLNQTSSVTYSHALRFALSNVVSHTPVVYIEFYYPQSDSTFIYYLSTEYNSLREEELRYETMKSDNVTTTICFSLKAGIDESAKLNMCATAFLIVVLITGSYFFSVDVNNLVIKPIEKMVDLVRQISANPLGVQYKMLGPEDGFHEGFETTVLLSTITKIGGLMRVGFGEAGASVIAKNLSESSGGDLNLMGSGTMIKSIFGFCDIRKFTDTTECLQEEVMLFVNRIAHILHTIVTQCSGSANKNIGDAFLLTWKVDENHGSAESQIKTQQADQALMAFLKTLIELNRRQEFICNFSAAATARLYKRFPDYEVKIGCGLHYGWAIEGAIGTNHKIDASYLSPHVNFTEYLESSTKDYEVPLLISEPFYRMLSPEAAKWCRQVDRIRRTDSEAPVGLYTYDCDLSENFMNLTRQPKVTVNSKPRRQSMRQTPPRVVLKQTLRSVSGDRIIAKSFDGDRDRVPIAAASLSSASIVGNASGGSHTGFGKDKEKGKEKDDVAPTLTLPPYTRAVWEEDEDLLNARRSTIDAKFRKYWEDGFNCYISGHWAEAAEFFHRTMEMTSNTDGPSKYLLRFMSQTNFVAQEDWPGYRRE